MTPGIIAIVIPTYGAFDYAARAITSVLDNTRALTPHVIVVDDASPEWTSPVPLIINEARMGHGGYFSAKRFPTNGGLTRSWNYGLASARNSGADFACVANSDLIFAPGWDEGIYDALQFGGFSLAGPVTNAPGSNHEQHVRLYSVRYDPKKADDPVHLADVQSELAAHQTRRTRETILNGFCMVALTDTWWANAYDKDHVFRPRNDFNSKGERNPTPLMTLNEYEIQARWRNKGLKAAACLSSYVYHYRAVSRGDKHKQGDWARIRGAT